MYVLLNWGLQEHSSPSPTVKDDSRNCANGVFFVLTWFAVDRDEDFSEHLDTFQVSENQGNMFLSKYW